MALPGSCYYVSAASLASGARRPLFQFCYMLEVVTLYRNRPRSKHGNFAARETEGADRWRGEEACRGELLSAHPSLTAGGGRFGVHLALLRRGRCVFYK